MFYWGLECKHCGKAVFFYDHKPKVDKAILLSHAIFKRGYDRSKLKSGDKIHCQYCGKPSTRTPHKFSKLFNYDNGKELIQ